MTGTDLITTTRNVATVSAAENYEFRLWRIRNHEWRRWKTLPYLAARENRPDLVRHLCENGYKKYCERAIVTVIREKNAQALSALLKGGAEMNIDQAGEALREAAEYDAPECLARLLQLDNMPLNARNSQGWTALGYAARRNSGACVKLLLEAGADETIKFKAIIKGREQIATALDVAEAHGYYNAMDMFAEYAKKRGTAPLASPAPEQPAPAPQAEEKPRAEFECPAGWSAVFANGAELAVQTIDDEASGTYVRNLFDFKGKRLLTEFGMAANRASSSDKSFSEVDAAFVTEARRIFEALRAQKKSEQAAPGLT
jgi:hypothetical protein